MFSESEARVAVLERENATLRGVTPSQVPPNVQTAAVDVDEFEWTEEDAENMVQETRPRNPPTAPFQSIGNSLMEIEKSWKDFQERAIHDAASNGSRIDMTEFERTYKNIFVKKAIEETDVRANEANEAARVKRRNADLLAERRHRVESEVEVTRVRHALEAEKEKNKTSDPTLKANIAGWISSVNGTVESQLGRLIPWHFCYQNPGMSDPVKTYTSMLKEVIKTVHPTFFTTVTDPAKRHNEYQLTNHIDYGVNTLLLKDVYTPDEYHNALKWFQGFIAYLLAIHHGKLLQKTVLVLQAKGARVSKPADGTTRQDVINEETAFYSLLWRSLSDEHEFSKLYENADSYHRSAANKMGSNSGSIAMGGGKGTFATNNAKKKAALTSQADDEEGNEGQK